MPTSIPRPPGNGIFVFDTPDQMIEALFGPDQHYDHVKRRRRHLWLVNKAAENDARGRALEQYMRNWIARNRAACATAAHEAHRRRPLVTDDDFHATNQRGVS